MPLSIQRGGCGKDPRAYLIFSVAKSMVVVGILVLRRMMIVTILSNALPLFIST